MSTGQDGFLGRAKAEWTFARDTYLVELLMQQHINGRTAYKEFKNEVIKFVTWEFNKKFGMNLEDNQIRNRHNVMKKDYGIGKTLLSHKEFAWDETRHMVVVDDRVWDNYIMARSEARPFRRKSFPLYKQMSIIFEGERGISKGQLPSGAMAPLEEVNNYTQTIRSSEPCNLPTQVIVGTLVDSDSTVCINDVLAKKHKLTNPTESIRKKRAHLKIREALENTLYDDFTIAMSKIRQ